MDSSVEGDSSLSCSTSSEFSESFSESREVSGSKLKWG